MAILRNEADSCHIKLLGFIFSYVIRRQYCKVTIFSSEPQCKPYIPLHILPDISRSMCCVET